ncbi:MAG: bifunctional homocysteine S-methyltransferase/methylenetetrahydrofolate reductase, partial [Gemmatimonadota bacterium]|nr:bifunctional homocysteine S-methyltransferase/methylenetetrahydrofolate reductase [Gemmatimonadota bacterium]
QPQLIKRVLLEYTKAGAELLTTNTFCANRIKLRKSGLEDKFQAINVQGARIAREVAGSALFVAGSIGPLGERIEPFGTISEAAAREFFREQAVALLEGGADLIILETFSDLVEILQAAAAIQSLGEIPFIAQMTVGEDGLTAFGHSPEVFGPELEKTGAAAVGLNCSVGPSKMLEPIQSLCSLVACPVSAVPNAGYPRTVQGRTVYLSSPEYMAKYARLFIQVGATIVGGCCGTTPEHIKEMRQAVRAAAQVRVRCELGEIEEPADDGGRQTVPMAKRSRFAARLVRGNFVSTVEIIPPRGVTVERVLKRAAKLKEAGVDAINIPDGPRAQCRMSALALSVLIQERIGIETICHYCCRDRNLLGMQSDLLGAAALNIKNLLVITGDPPKMGPYPDSTAVFDIDSIGLVNLVNRFNRGLDLGCNPIGPPTSFVIGVGVNPGALNLDEEITRFKLKYEAGAEFAITQPVFDAAVLRRFLEQTKSIPIPVLAGIWPLTSYTNAEFLQNEIPEVTIPEPIMERMRKASLKGSEHALEEGVAVAGEILDEIRPMIQGVQVSAPMGRISLAIKLVNRYNGV